MFPFVLIGTLVIGERGDRDKVHVRTHDSSKRLTRSRDGVSSFILHSMMHHVTVDRPTSDVRPGRD